MPAGALILPLAEGGASLDLGGGATSSQSFVVDAENGLLPRAIEDFCAAPSSSYNPLVLYGPPGIGKTHLVRGIACRLGAERPAARIVCVTGSEFAGGYADALSSHSVSRWREAFRSPALAVIDDVGDLVEKQPAQIELLHTIDAVVETGNQVLVTAHTVPSRIPRLLSALASRLTAGLVVAVPLPGPRVRLAMLLRMAADRDISVDDAALHLLARALPVTIPELSGALHEITAGCVCRQTVTRAMVATYLRRRPTTGQTTLRAIAARTARQFALAVADLRGPSRRQNVVTARAVAVYLARQLTSQSLAAVGRYFGGRDHTTVLHGCRRAEELMAEETGVRQTVLDLRAALSSG